MTAMHRQLRYVGISLLLALAAAGSAAPGATIAASPSAVGAEFDRITADIRAAVERHDARAAHLYEAQLDRLIVRATGR